MPPKTRVRRATVHIPSPELATVIVRGYGYAADCSDCGRVGKVTTYREAYKAKRAHEVWHRESPRVSLAGPV
jgi:hypothetical protein